MNYLGACAVAVGIWQRTFPFRGSSEGECGCFPTGASAQWPDHSKQGEPHRGCRTGGLPFPSGGTLQGWGAPRTRKWSSQTLCLREIRDERKQSWGGERCFRSTSWWLVTGSELCMFMEPKNLNQKAWSCETTRAWINIKMFCPRQVLTENRLTFFH